MKDSFGINVASGDYILSAPASRFGYPKIGTVYFTEAGTAMLEVEHGGESGRRRTEVGSYCAVLRKANGDVPAHIGGEGDRLVVNGKSRAVVETELHDTDEEVFGYYVWVARTPEDKEGDA